MGRSRSPIALDFRDRELRALQIEQRADVVRVLGAHRVRLRGDGGSTADRTERRIEAGRRLLREARFRGREAVVAVGPDGIDTRRIRIPVDRLEQAAEILAREVRGAAPDGAELTILPIPVADLFDQGQTKREFLCCAAQGASVDELIRVTEAIGLLPAAIDLEPCALVRPFASRSQDSYLHLDLGPHRSSITVVRAGGPVLMKASRFACEPMAGRLRERLQLDVQALLDLGRSPGSPHRELHDAIVGALAEPLEALLLELSAAVRYCGSLFQGRAVTVLRVSGDLAELPGLVPHLGRRIGITAEVADPFAAVDMGPLPLPTLGGRSGFCTAMGLALREVP